jgi:DNA-binding transcriptional LysR family regulator
MIGEFRRAYPEVELAISEMEMSQQLDQLDQGKLDIGFIRPPVPLPLGIVSTPVLFEEIMLALPRDHALAEEERVSLSALNGDVFITPRHPAGVSFHAHTNAACRVAGFFPRLGPQGRDFVTIASMVAIGLGVALVPQSLQSIRVPGLRYRAIAGEPVLAELAVAYRRNEPSPVARAFAAHARKAAPVTIDNL